MNGIEILSTAEVVVATSFNWAVCLPVAIIVFLVIGIGVYFLCRLEQGSSQKSNIIFAIAMGLMVALMAGALSGFMAGYPTKYETQYKVTIDDTVLINEFNEHYEIIDQEGKIYTVRERK